jgi:catechol 2,3-dioxygenase-like lactoylglutathione lyase family enzyme
MAGTELDHIEIGGASPCFIVRRVPETLAFYRDKLGFEITYEGPELDDIFFGIVQRGHAMLMFKAVGLEPMPNHSQDIGKGNMRWDAYVYVPDPDALYEEFSTQDVEFVVPLGNNSDNLRGFEVKDVNGYMIFFGRPNS